MLFFFLIGSLKQLSKQTQNSKSEITAAKQQHWQEKNAIFPTEKDKNREKAHMLTSVYLFPFRHLSVKIKIVVGNLFQD